MAFFIFLFKFFCLNLTIFNLETYLFSMKKMSLLLSLLLAMISCQKSKNLLDTEKTASKGLTIYLANGEIKDIEKNANIENFLKQVIQDDNDEMNRNLPLSIDKVEILSTDREKTMFVVDYRNGEEKNNFILLLENVLDTNFDFAKILPRGKHDEVNLNYTYRTRYRCVKETCNQGCSLVVYPNDQFTCFCGNKPAVEGSCWLEISNQ